MTNKEQKEIQKEILRLNKQLDALYDQRDIDSAEAHQKAWIKYKPKIKKINDKIEQIQDKCTHKFNKKVKNKNWLKECSICGLEKHKDLI